MSDQYALTFARHVLDRAGDVPGSALNRAIAEFVQKGRLSDADIADCLLLAGRIAGKGSDRTRRARESPITQSSRRLSMEMSDAITPLVEDTRRRIFGNAGAPFRSLSQALAWIEAPMPSHGLTPAVRRRADRLQKQVLEIGRELVQITKGFAVASVKQRSETIAYQRPGDPWIHHRPVGIGESPLAILREAAHSIAAATDYDEAAVTSHILTGEPLRLPAVRYSVGRVPGRLPDGRWITRGRVTLTLFTPDISDQVWRQIRRRIRRDWPDRAPGLSRAEERVLREVAATEGVPRKGKVTYWQRIARRLGDRAWRTTMMRYRRAKAKLGA